MNLINFKAFIKVAESGSMTKAAKELGYTQPGISHMIDNMEKEFGIPLLIRRKDSLSLTKEGAAILPHCLRIINEERTIFELIESMHNLTTGEIRIGALNSLLVKFIPQAARGFADTYPGVKLRFIEETYSEINSMLQNGSIDIGFSNSLIPKGFEFFKLFDDPICLIIPADHQFTRYDRVPVSALNGCRVIVPQTGWDDMYNAVLQKESFSPCAQHHVASDTAAVSMVAENMGVCMISKLQTGLLPKKVAVRELDGDFCRSLGICVKSLTTASPAVRKFVAHVRDYAEKNSPFEESGAAVNL